MPSTWATDNFLQLKFRRKGEILDKKIFRNFFFEAMACILHKGSTTPSIMTYSIYIHSIPMLSIIYPAYDFQHSNKANATLRVITLSIITLNIKTLSLKTLSIIALSTITLSKITVSIITLSIIHSA